MNIEQESEEMSLLSSQTDPLLRQTDEFSFPSSFLKIQEIEKEILSNHDIEVGKDIIIKNVRVNLNGMSEDWIHTYISKDQGKEKKRAEKPVLVLIHGYGGGSILFLKMIKTLSKTFKVYCMDIIGLSLSSRPSVEHLSTPQEIIEFFVNSIVEWVKEVGLSDTAFYLAGHSFGGYLASFYCKNNQENVKRLILISPAGISKISKMENEQYVRKQSQRSGFKDKIMHWLRKQVWKYEITYEWMYSICFLPRKAIMAHMISSRLKAKSRREIQLWQSYFSLVLSLPISTSKFVYKLFFYPRVVAHIPAEDAFKQEMNVKVHFLYGEKDWMNREGAQRLIKNNKELFSSEIISNSGHHINIDNPDELSSKIANLALLDQQTPKQKFSLIFDLDSNNIQINQQQSLHSV